MTNAEFTALLRKQANAVYLATEKGPADDLSSSLHRAAIEIDQLELGWKNCSRACAKMQDERDQLALKLVTAEKEIDTARAAAFSEGIRSGELQSRLDDALKELDEASPLRRCDRCGKEDRLHRMVFEEGDEVECMPCWERCNAEDRASQEAMYQLDRKEQEQLHAALRASVVVAPDTPCPDCGAQNDEWHSDGCGRNSPLVVERQETK